MQQVFDAGFSPYTGIVLPVLNRERVTNLLEAPPGQAAPQQARVPGTDAPKSSAPQIRIFPHGGALQVRVDHELRDTLHDLQRVFGAFFEDNLHPLQPCGFNQPNNTEMDIKGLMQALRTAHEKCERISVDRGDGLATSLTLRSISAEAAKLLEYILVGMVTHEVRDGDLAGVLHTVSDAKRDVRRLIEQFDLSMLQYVEQSGVLQRAMGQGKKGQPSAQ